MLHDPHPLVDLLRQISGSNAGSNLLVKIVGQIAGRIHWSNLSVEFLDQIGWSNCWVKFAGQIRWSNAANQMQPILGPTLASLGARMGTPADGLKMA